ncbi:MAG: gamma carbonic anhydrase family protein [Candidatus Helarchaeota archaeon]|nr:gamma carbonic anhydrase family protein [Candidatus Helarchaeota archaeon]
MTIVEFDGIVPKIDPSVIILEGCTILGRVEIGPDTVIYPGTIIRGDTAKVKIGSKVVIQDGVMINSSAGNICKIGDNSLIAFGSILHGTVVGSNCVIGIRSILMPGTKVKDNSMIGAMSYVLRGTVPEGKVYVGIPAVEKRDMRDKDHNMWDLGKKTFRDIALKYKSSS